MERPTEALERSIIGYIFRYQDELIKVIETGVTPEMFSVHREIYEEILKRFKNKDKYGTSSIAVTFPDKALLLAELETNAPTNFVTHETIALRYKYDLTYFKTLLRETHEQITTNKEMTGNPLQQIMSGLISGIFERTSSFKKSKQWREAILDVVDQVEKDFEGNEIRKPLNTGNNTLDLVLGKYCNAKYVTISAETGIGKSTLALNIAMNMSARGNKIVYFTQEMTDREILEKGALMNAGISWETHINKKHSARDMDNLLEALRGLSDTDSFIDYARPDIDDILLESLRLIHTEKIDAIFIDYIQQLESRAYKSYDQREIMKHISKKILNFSLQHDIPIFVVAQLNRMSKDARPIDLINNIADSSSISKDTTFGLAIVVESDNNGVEKSRYLVKTKGRYGPRGRLPRVFFNAVSHKYNTDY